MARAQCFLQDERLISRLDQGSGQVAVDTVTDNLIEIRILMMTWCPKLWLPSKNLVLYEGLLRRPTPSFSTPPQD
jgi:hypothetical protein